MTDAPNSFRGLLLLLFCDHLHVILCSLLFLMSNMTVEYEKSEQQQLPLKKGSSLLKTETKSCYLDSNMVLVCMCVQICI